VSNSAVAIRKGRSRKRRFLNRTVLLIIVATIVTWGLFLVLRLNREASTDYDRIMADCIRDRNQKTPPAVARDAAAIATDCARNTRSGQ
jgi:hypothetical protein